MSPRFRIELPSRNYLPGEIVTGRVVITAPGHSRRLQVSLSFRELSAETFTARPRHVPGPIVHTGMLRLDAVLPFSIKIPADALPNAVGQHGMLHWTVDVRSHEFGPDTEELAGIWVQSPRLPFTSEQEWSSDRPQIRLKSASVPEVPVPIEVQQKADKEKDLVAEFESKRSNVIIMAVLGMLMWGGVLALELFGVVSFGEDASPVGQKPAMVAGTIGFVMLFSAPCLAFEQTPPESRVRRIPGFCWVLMVACVMIGLIVIGRRSGLSVPLWTGILSSVFLIGFVICYPFIKDDP